MGARRGHNGESCREVMRETISQDEVVSCTEFYDRVKLRGDWSDDTIWQHFMALTINLVPAKHRWNMSKQFLFLRPDGRYELYDERKHPRVIE